VTNVSWGQNCPSLRNTALDSKSSETAAQSSQTLTTVMWFYLWKAGCLNIFRKRSSFLPTTLNFMCTILFGFKIYQLGPMRISCMGNTWCLTNNGEYQKTHLKLWRQVILKNIYYSWALVVHTCNPSYSGGRDQEDHSSKPAQANSSWDPISKNLS
jgi:hypothetical protein